MSSTHSSKNKSYTLSYVSYVSEKGEEEFVYLMQDKEQQLAFRRDIDFNIIDPTQYGTVVAKGKGKPSLKLKEKIQDVVGKIAA